MPDDLIQLLRAVAESKKHRWRGDFDTQLDQQSSEFYLRDAIAAIYHRVFCDFENPDDSRWYDPYHILFSTSFALRLVQALKDSIPRIELIIPAVLLHDVGYYAVPDKTQWSGEQSRIVHMQEGAARSARVLWECGNRLKPEDVEAIVGMVAVHDNPYIGLPIGQTRLRRALRDCDRVWVMHALSFYKDWHHKKANYLASSEGIEDSLADRTVQFFGIQVPDSLTHRIHQPLPALVEKNQHRVEEPHFPLTKKCVEKLIERRWEEIDCVRGRPSDDVYECLRNRVDYLEERIDEDFGLVDAL
jgi:hypothetical protein